MPRLRNLIVVVPGIGGSELSGPDGQQLYRPDGPGIARVLHRPDRLALPRWDDDREPAEDGVVPTGLIRTTMVFPPLWIVPGYDSLCHQLRTRFDARIATYRPGTPADPDTDVLLVPYDFRRSMRQTAAWLDTAVTTQLAARAGSGRPEPHSVIVVAHSMGGLIARYWMTELCGAGWCRALLTLGTPHRGAPKALDWLVNGVRLGPRTLQDATGLLRGWPSVYELLPQYEAVRDTTGARLWEPPDLPVGCVRTAGAGPDVAATVLARAGQAAALHDRIRVGWATLPESGRPRLSPFFARGHATLNAAYLDPVTERLTVDKSDPPWRGNLGWRGDGTVPAIAAIPADLNDEPDRWSAVVEPHGRIPSAAEVVKLLHNYLSGPLPARGVAPQWPWLGLDVEEFTASGQPVAVRATLLGQGPDLQAAPRAVPAEGVGLVIRSAEGPGDPVWRGRLAPDDRDGWSVRVPPLPVGLYALTLEAVGVPEVDLVYATTELAVTGDPTAPGNGDQP